MARALATREELIALSPSTFEGADVCALDVYLEIAGTMINLGVWGSKASHGHRLLAAHFYAVSLPGGETGPLASVAVGPASKSFAVSASTDAELGSTTWGRMYLALRRSLPRTPIVVLTSGFARGQFR